MKVKALKKTFVGGVLRDAGEVFEAPEGFKVAKDSKVLEVVKEGKKGKAEAASESDDKDEGAGSPSPAAPEGAADQK